MEGLNNLKKERARSLQIIHQTGEEDFKKVKSFYKQCAVKSVTLPYIHEMVDAYNAADLVICRAGATTLAEITVLGKASILIPYPYAVRDHQMINAQVLEKARAAEVIADGELAADTLWPKIHRFMDHREELIKMQQNAKKLGKPKAAQRIVQESLRVIEKENKMSGKRRCF